MDRRLASTPAASTHLVDTLVVKFRAWDEARVAEVVSGLGGALRSTIPAIRWAVIVIDPALASSLFLAYESHPDIEDAWFDEECRPDALYATGFDDPLLGAQWNLHRMSVPQAWRHATGEGIIAAVIDSGMDTVARGEPEFAGKTMFHWNGYYNGAEAGDPYTGDPMDVTGNRERTPYFHGLACIGLLCGDGRNDARGAVGVAPGASLVNMASWNYDKNVVASAIATGIIESVDRFGAKVLSLSLATGSGTGAPTLTGAVPDAIQYVKSRAIVFASAGNSGTSREDHGYWQNPAYAAQAFGAGFSVGCTEPNLDAPVGYSCYGEDVNTVAPGESVWTPYYQSVSSAWFREPPGWNTDNPFPTAMTTGSSNTSVTFRLFNGTSAACPLAAGVCALIWSVNPSLSADQVRGIYASSMDAPSNWLFKLRFPRPGTGIPNALRGVLKAKALTTPGAVFPFVGFQGAGVTMTVVAGVPTTHLRGPLRVDVDGFSTDAITNVQLWAGAKLVYSGPPRRAMEGTELLLDAGFLTDGNIRVVASTSGATGDETYTDITAHARVAGVIAPPRTFATPASGHLLPGQTVALSAQSDAHPVRISYRVSGGAWQRYTAPFLLPDGNQTLEFFGVDYLGNVEGGVDHDP